MDRSFMENKIVKVIRDEIFECNINGHVDVCNIEIIEKSCKEFNKLKILDKKIFDKIKDLTKSLERTNEEQIVEIKEFEEILNNELNQS